MFQDRTAISGHLGDMKATEKQPWQFFGLEDTPNAVTLLVCSFFALLGVSLAWVPRQDSLMSARGSLHLSHTLSSHLSSSQTSVCVHFPWFQSVRVLDFKKGLHPFATVDQEWPCEHNVQDQHWNKLPWSPNNGFQLF